MAVVIVNEMQGGSEGLYEQISASVMPGGQLPAGCKSHVAGPMDGGWRVITVWDSDEQFQQFRNDRLIPAIQSAGQEGVVAPKIESQSVHTYITA